MTATNNTTKIEINQRKSLKDLIKDLKQVRSSQSVSCIMGKGWTVVRKGTHDQINVIKKDDGNGKCHYNWAAKWNSKSTYWTKEDALKTAKNLMTGSCDHELEVKHYNDLRDHHGVMTEAMIKLYYTRRNEPVTFIEVPA
jgi:hypothetical protein